MFCIIQTTAPTKKSAKKLAKMLLARRLAACVQITKIRSLYRWDGELCAGREWLLSVKTTAAQRDTAAAAIAQNHPYEVPEIAVLAADFVGGYGAWVRGEVGGAELGADSVKTDGADGVKTDGADGADGAGGEK